MQVEFTHRLAWRSASECSADALREGTLLGEGNLDCQSGCSGTIGSTKIRCTDFSTTQNWYAGQASNTFTFAADTQNFEAS